MQRKGIKKWLIARGEIGTWTGVDLLLGWQEAAVAPPSPAVFHTVMSPFAARAGQAFGQ